LKINKKIFGKTIAIQNTISCFDKEIQSEFSLYQDAARNNNPDINIYITNTSTIIPQCTMNSRMVLE
jgi:plastocyanin domain-containing protein